MSFFLAVCGDTKGIELDGGYLLRNVDECQLYLQRAVRHFFDVNAEIHMISEESDNDNCQKLVEKTQIDLGYDIHINETKLGKLIQELMSNNLAICLWFATESSDEFKHVHWFINGDKFLKEISCNIQNGPIFETLLYQS